jgi:hypothetical protein
MKNIVLILALSVLFLSCHKKSDLNIPYEPKPFSDLKLEHELIQMLGANLLSNYHDYDIIKDDENIINILNKKNNMSLILIKSDSTNYFAKLVDNRRGVNYTFKKDKIAEIIKFYKDLTDIKENERITILYYRLKEE